MPLGIEEVWEFFSNPASVVHMTPPWLGFKMTSPAPEKMYPGMILTYAFTPVPGIQVEWVAEITHVEEKRLFVDEQRSGPYNIWHHQHIFKEAKDGTLVKDLVHYALPLGPLGRALHELMVKGQLREIFDFRRSYLEKRFGAA